MRSKRFEALAKRPVNQDGFVKEWTKKALSQWKARTTQNRR